MKLSLLRRPVGFADATAFSAATSFVFAFWYLRATVLVLFLDIAAVAAGALLTCLLLSRRFALSRTRGVICMHSSGSPTY